MYSGGVHTDLAVELAIAAGRFTRTVTRLSDSEMPRALWRILAHLAEAGPCRVTQLAKLDRVSQPTATKLVGRLREAGWVTTEPDPSDGRATLVMITAAGVAKLGALRRGAGAVLAEQIAELTPADRDVLVRATELMRQLA